MERAVSECPASLLGDHRPVPCAVQPGLPAGMPRRGQGEGEGRDDHLLPHQRAPGELSSSCTHTKGRQNKEPSERVVELTEDESNHGTTLGSGRCPGRTRVVGRAGALLCSNVRGHTHTHNSTHVKKVFSFQGFSLPSCFMFDLKKTYCLRRR